MNMVLIVGIVFNGHFFKKKKILKLLFNKNINMFCFFFFPPKIIYLLNIF